MGPLLERAMAYFQEDDWDIHPISDTVVQTAFKGDNGEWDCLAVVLGPSDHFLFGILPKVPENLFTPMALFLIAQTTVSTSETSSLTSARVRFASRRRFRRSQSSSRTNSSRASSTTTCLLSMSTCQASSASSRTA